MRGCDAAPEAAVAAKKKRPQRRRNARDKVEEPAASALKKKQPMWQRLRSAKGGCCQKGSPEAAKKLPEG
jgi:hypothetical protein